MQCFSTCLAKKFTLPDRQEKIYGVNGIWGLLLNQVLVKIYLHLNHLIAKKIVDPRQVVMDIIYMLRTEKTRLQTRKMEDSQ